MDSMVASRSSSATPRPSAAIERAKQSQDESRHDAILVHRFQRGDEAAFVEIVTRHRGKMIQIAWGILRDHSDAEEIAQDTFMRAHRGLAKFRGDSSLATWLYHIALNLSRNRYWYHHRRFRHATVHLDAPCHPHQTASCADLVACDAPSPAHEAVTGEFAAIVTRCMAQLPAGQRDILTLRNVHQQSYGRISQTLGIRIGTAKSRIARARGNLRALLTPFYTAMTRLPLCSDPPWFDTLRPGGLMQRARG
jgi:RNA polymerase sigma-70 factor, ECF subfamily